MKSLEISWVLTKNLKQSHYHISADSFIKNKIAYDFRNEIMSKWISKKLMDFGWNEFILMRLWVEVFVSQQWVQAEIEANSELISKIIGPFNLHSWPC